MSKRPYTEDQLCEQPAIELFAELGWQTVCAAEEIFGNDGTLGRETPSEVVLESRLRVALERLNSALPAEAITAALDELTRDRSAMGLPAANRELYRLRLSRCKRPRSDLLSPGHGGDLVTAASGAVGKVIEHSWRSLQHAGTCENDICPHPFFRGTCAFGGETEHYLHPE